MSQRIKLQAHYQNDSFYIEYTSQKFYDKYTSTKNKMANKTIVLGV